MKDSPQVVMFLVMMMFAGVFWGFIEARYHTQPFLITMIQQFFFSHNFNNENHHDYVNRRYFDLYESGVPVLVLGRSWGQEAGHGMDGEAMMMVAKVMVRVAKCQFFYTDHFCPTKFTPRESA